MPDAKLHLQQLEWDLKRFCFTVSMDSVALMPCNPNIGGSSKGHLVKEIDALGGEMGKNIDKTYLQSKMLNKSKGPAVHSLRAQADKKMYSISMTQVMGNTPNLTLRQGEVTEILVEDGKIKGVKTYSGAVYYAKAVVLKTGTYFKGALYLWRSQQSYRTKWTSGSKLSDRFLEESWNLHETI